MSEDLSKWIVVELLQFNLTTDSTAFSVYTETLGNMWKFCFDNFDKSDFRERRKPLGYFSLSDAILFRNEEDAVAFKLAFSGLIDQNKKS